MAGPKPHFSPHAAFASASAAPNLTADSDSDADADAEVIFRLLLPRAFSDADAIRLYAAIAPLRRRTAALQVRVEDLDASDAAGGRVAVVLGPASPTRRVEASSSSGEPLELSPAQEALIAVLDSGGVLHRDERRGPEVVTCLVLVEAAQLEAAFGRRILGAIAREAGAEVCVAPWEEDAPPRAQPPEEIIEV